MICYTKLEEASALLGEERSFLTVKDLLRQGKDPSGRSDVTTTLTYAVYQNSVRALHELCAHGADANKATRSNLTPLTIGTKYATNIRVSSVR